MAVWRHALGSAAVLALSIVAAAGASSQRATTPEEAIAALETAARAGDLDAFAALLAEPPRTLIQSLLSGMKRTEAAHDALVRAVDARFGKEEDPSLARQPGETTGEIRANLQRTVSIKVSKKEPDGAGFKLQVESVEKAPGRDETTSRTESFSAVREGDAWKLLPDELTRGQERARQMVDDLERYAKAIEQIARDVGSGTFKTRDEVREAVGKARQPR